MKCATHTDVETGLACGKCGTPICPKCLVETPVGTRCRKCANVRRLPTYSITPVQYLRAVAAGVGIAIAVGIAWAWLRIAVDIPFLGFMTALLLAAGAAYVIAEVVSRVINRKRGTPLQIIAGACFVLSYLVSNVWLSENALTFFAYFDLIDILIVAVGIAVTTARLR
jgi:hypothetical protein